MNHLPVQLLSRRVDMLTIRGAFVLGRISHDARKGHDVL
jgi:hypothetical protein